MENFDYVHRVPLVKVNCPRPSVFAPSVNSSLSTTSKFVPVDVNPETLSIDNLVSSGVNIGPGNTTFCENYDDSIEQYLSDNLEQKIEIKHETED